MKKRIRLPIATIAISALLVLFYFIVSGGSAYVVPLSRIYPLGVSGYNLLGAFTYLFMHIGVKHLLGNLIAFIVFGAILEQDISKTHVLGIFLASGVLGGIGYALLNPAVWVVGASAAIAGILVAAAIAEPKNTLIALLLVLYFVPNVILPATDGVLNHIEGDRLVAAAKAKMGIMELENKTGGNYSDAALRERALLEERYRRAIGSRETMESGRKTEAATPASFEIHAIGGLVAVAFMFLFDKKIVEGVWRRISGAIKS